MNKTICLIGNPNCGKTTLFNTLTGTYQKVGNWTGVTTEKTEGVYKKDKTVQIVDLPGLYSFDANSIDEKVVTTYLKETPPDCIISVLDGTNLQRNLLLALKLLSLNIPMVLAINYADILKKQGINIDTNFFEEAFNCEVVLISALKNLNVNLLMKKAINTIKKPKNLTLENVEKTFDFIDKLLEKAIKTTKNIQREDKLDNFLTGKFTGIFTFFIIITLIYFLAIKCGGYLGDYIADYTEKSTLNIKNYLEYKGINEIAIGIFTDGVIKGLGTIFSFLPQILILFFFLSLIEESGYASRIALIFDRFFSLLGLSGKTLLPLIVCSGCTVSGLMATRTIESTSERRLTIFISPFIPCGAKTMVFGWFSSVIFNGNPFIASSMYFLGIFTAVITSKILSNLKAFSEDKGEFLLEIPPYRMPSIKNVALSLIQKVKDFTIKAGTTILAVSVFLWVLTNFGINGYTNGQVQKSFVFSIGSVLKYIFYPLGFCNEQTAVSILSGLFAKEGIIESLTAFSKNTILFDNGFSAYSFMAFTLLSPPCTSSLITAKKELGVRKWFYFMLAFQTITAYIVAMLINLIGQIVMGKMHLLLIFIFVIILSIIIFAIKRGEKWKKAKPYTTV